MSEAANLSAALMLLAKAVKPLSDEDLKLVTAGQAKLTVLYPDQQVVQKSKALTQALKFLGQLSDHELSLIESGQAKLALLRKGDKILSALDIAEVAAQITKLGAEDEIIRFLDDDSRLNPTNLKKIAAELNIGVPAAVKGKAELQLLIAQTVVRDRGRWSWR
jgi:hypothetical protein